LYCYCPAAFEILYVEVGLVFLTISAATASSLLFFQCLFNWFTFLDFLTLLHIIPTPNGTSLGLPRPAVDFYRLDALLVAQQTASRH